MEGSWDGTLNTVLKIEVNSKVSVESIFVLMNKEMMTIFFTTSSKLYILNHEKTVFQQQSFKCPTLKTTNSHIIWDLPRETSLNKILLEASVIDQIFYIYWITRYKLILFNISVGIISANIEKIMKREENLVYTYTSYKTHHKDTTFFHSPPKYNVLDVIINNNNYCILFDKFITIQSRICNDKVIFIINYQ